MRFLAAAYRFSVGAFLALGLLAWLLLITTRPTASIADLVRRIAAFVVVALALAGCASAQRESWRPFEQECAVVDRHPVAVPVLPGERPQPDRHVLYLNCGGVAIRDSDVSMQFYLLAAPGQCVLAKGEARGGYVRRVTLTWPCRKDEPRRGATPGADT